MEDQQHVLLLAVHHIAFDGWSEGVLFRELGALYRAFAAGQPSPLPELDIQYADYAAWQRQRCQSEALASELAYWQEHLAGAPPLLEVPTDRPRPPQQSYRGQTLQRRLPRELSAALKRLSESEQATLYMTLLAAFEVLLYRYTGQDDLVVGSALANRSQPELERLIGFFVNTVGARRPVRGTDVPRAVGTCPPNHVGGVCTPGCSIRDGSAGRVPAAKRRLLAAVPGDVCAANRLGNQLGTARRSRHALAAGSGYGQVRSDGFRF